MVILRNCKRIYFTDLIALLIHPHLPLTGNVFLSLSPHYSFGITQIKHSSPTNHYTMTIASFCLLLFILNLTIAVGAGLYETRIVLPLWFVRQADNIYFINTTAMQQTDTGRRFWGMVTTLPLTLLSLINLYYAFSSNTVAHIWWLLGTLLILLERLATFTFFIPTAIALQSNKNLPVEKKSRLAVQWLRFNYLRNGATTIGMLLCLKAFLSLVIQGV